MTSSVMQILVDGYHLDQLLPSPSRRRLTFEPLREEGKKPLIILALKIQKQLAQK